MNIVDRPIRVKPTYIRLIRGLIHSAATIWLTLILYLGFAGQLPGDPVQYLLDFTGISALNLLLISLCISPLSEYLKFGQLIRIRKTLGVYAAIYALSHFGVFIAFELQFEWGLIFEEIVERPYITVGFVGLLILSALLATSFDKVKKRMGKTWGKLHNYVYLALMLIVLHFIWSIKADELAPLIYAGLSVILLSLRITKLKRIFI